MELSKRSLIIFSLGWLVSLSLVGFVAGYYYMEFQKEAQLSGEYAGMYNELMQNYTDLLDEYLRLVQQCESEKQNLTELLEKYGSCIMRVNIRIDYREWNGTVVWYNDTIVPLGCNLLQATETVALVNFTYWPAYQASFVDAINGVWNYGACFWMWHRWTDDQRLCEYGDAGADRCELSNNEIAMWRYEIPSYG